jgi:hypothetical protein
MKEEYLHYIFKNKLLGNTFVSTENKKVEILDFGIHNHNSGPDFLEGKIKIDDKIWAGQIEFHVKSSDWIKHNHQNDSNYNNVIIHFVYQHDLEVKSGEYNLPTIELKSLIDQNHYDKYASYIESQNWIACENEIQIVDDFIIYQQKEKALINRLQRKSNYTIDLVEFNLGDRKKTFYTLLFKAFGTKVNKSAFQILSEKFDWKIITKLNYDLFKIEAYLFGLAGFLNGESEDDYFNQLKTEYQYLSKLFNINEMNKAEWKFSAMRPYNLPTVRIAQLASLLTNKLNLLDDLDLNKIKSNLKSGISNYWKIHYMFERIGKKQNPGLTNNFIDLILTNVYVPFVFAIGILEDNENYKSTALNWLDKIRPEQNAILKKWKGLSVKNMSAFDSQALLEQKNEFCSKNLCLHCKIGQTLLKR